MRRVFLLLMGLSLLAYYPAMAQDGTGRPLFSVTVLNAQHEPLESAVVELVDPATKKLIKSSLSNKSGVSDFYIKVPVGSLLQTSFTGFLSQSIVINASLIVAGKTIVTLLPPARTLENVNVSTTRKPFIQQAQGKVIVNVDASVTNTGSTILEVLEKSPGVLVDKNGGISLQGKPGVLVLIDDKPTYLSGADLNNLLSGMSSSQVEQIELITSPSAKYDASGNAGIINIKTKKNKQVGFNGVFTTAYGQGTYPKSNHSLVLNYREGRFNTFLTLSSNLSENYFSIYALRKYYTPTGALASTLDQFSLFINKNFTNTIKTGVDFSASSKTTLGISVTGTSVSRTGDNDAIASWKNLSGATDSSIQTGGASSNEFRNGGINLNARHTLSKTQDISADIDMLRYNIHNTQLFNSTLQAVGGYTESTRGDLPSSIHIFSAKVDHHAHFGKNGKLESGYKLSDIQTDNIADYQLYNGSNWIDDPNKSNHFLYNEKIHALYSTYEQKLNRINFQIGVRYENTHYDGHQLGNSTHPDSSFAKNYAGLFPSGYLSYQADSSNAFTFTAGRRIDRPAFQKLNPFVTIINKYTYERGNPYFLPQYSWNMELSHQFKQILTTTVAYSIIKDYFSQLFLSEGTDILVYTQGNVGKMYNLALSMSVQANPLKWWSLSAQAIFNHKELTGYQNVTYASEVSQLNISMNNQFRINPVYTAELSGFYTTKARNDLQELLSPTGQVSAGISRPLFKKKLTLKMNVRDIFFTQVMEGNTDFPGATEYFLLRRDSRVFNISLTWRFGKPLKATRRSTGSAADEMQRVGSGG